MTTIPFSALFMALTATPCQAATLLVSGFLEGSAASPTFRGETMDYYKFEVITPGTVRIEVPLLFGGVYYLAAFIGVEDEFGFIGNPYRIETAPPCTFCTEPRVLERFLSEGTYVVVAAPGGPSSYDVFDGYVAVNPEGGGFIQGPYQYTITGDVRGLEYWDGHLDGTFTVTFIPEPASAALVGLAFGLSLWRRRRTRRP